MEHGSKKQINQKSQQKTLQKNSAWITVLVYVYDFFLFFLSEKFWFIQINTHKSIDIILVKRFTQRLSKKIHDGETTFDV